MVQLALLKMVQLAVLDRGPELGEFAAAARLRPCKPPLRIGTARNSMIPESIRRRDDESWRARC